MNVLNGHGLVFSYYLNPCKAWLLVMEENLEKINVFFESTDVSFNSYGRNDLGSPINILNLS